MIKTIILISLSVLAYMCNVANAQTQFIKYKDYLIPINVERSVPKECTDGKPRIIVTTDINSLSSGADPDDIQSMVHLLASSNQFETLGLISTPNNGSSTNNTKQHIENVIDAYSLDYNASNLAGHGYPSPNLFQVRQGLTNNTPINSLSYNPSNSTHQGAKLILDEAVKVLNRENCGPVYVLVWGGIPDVALALKESERLKSTGQLERGIEDVLRVYFIASYNKTGSLPGYQYIHDNFLKNNRLWFIQSENTFRGINGLGGRPTRNEKKTFLSALTNNQVTVHPNDQLTNTSNRSLRGVDSLNQSCLSYVLARSTDHLHNAPNQGSHLVKAGDTPSLLYVMNGDIDDPTSSSWGGQYKLANPSLSDKWYIDLSINGSDSRIYDSLFNPPSSSDALTVGNHVNAIFGDWIQSMNRLTPSHTTTCRASVSQTLQ